MPRCPNGHEQEFGLKCDVCGAEISFKSSVKKLLVLPTVRPDYGRVALLRVGFQGESSGVDYTGTVAVGETEASDATSFTVPRIQGGNWLEFKSKYQSKLGAWLKAVGFDKTGYRLVVLDAADPLSALALSALPQTKDTLVVAITADPDSTPMEQSSTYAALWTAMKRGIPVIALGGVGIVSVTSNEIPHEMAALTRAALANDWTTARQVNRKYLPLMQANFIESSPLPVKAVLAMMGKIEEVYRLPLVPMRRDTRSKLQRVATEAGLIAQQAGKAADAPEFFIYENWAAGPHKIVLHRGSCGQCSHGKGRPSGHDANHARWHGPYATLAQARDAAHTMTNILIRSECKCV